MKNRIPRKLKKRYKKMGIWYAYLKLKSFYDLGDSSFKDSEHD